jgi:CelD/BcsL family acetyltransferase involved in cellulose biosynthesis
MFARRVRHRGGATGRRLELLGQLWRAGNAVMSEYLDVAVLPEREVGAAEEMVEKINATHCSDVVFSNVREDGFASRCLVPALRSAGCYARACDPLDAWAVDLEPGFSGFLAGLTGSMRRRIHAGRRRLATLGPIRLETAVPGDESRFFETLNRLHRLRWGRVAFADRRLDFHVRLATTLNAAGEAALSTLIVNDRPVSCLYDLRRGGTQYNVQAGFDPDLGPGISPGYLHFGYAIEAAAAAGLRRYDLMAGEGKHTDYKARLATQRTGILTWQVVRAPALKALYRAYDALRRPG